MAESELTGRQHFVEVLAQIQSLWDANRPTGSRRLEVELGVSPETLSAWKSGRRLPSEMSLHQLRMFLVEIRQPMEFLKELERAIRDARIERRDYGLKPEIAALTIDEVAGQQIPAAFRFGIKDEKIDALPENAQAIDRPIAEDIYNELADKLRELVSRISRSNADPYVRTAPEGLLQSLGASFDQMRPGVVLSRMRTMEAAVDAISSDPENQGLLGDAIMTMNGVCQIGQDLLATFPAIREIERQRIALGVERTPESIAGILVETQTITVSVANSEVVSTAAGSALRENDTAIAQANQANKVPVAADLIADKLLVVRNFTSVALRSIADMGSAAWEEVGPDFKDGARNAARILPPLAVIGLVTVIAGPIAGIAALLKGDIFRPIKNATDEVKHRVPRKEPAQSNFRPGGKAGLITIITDFEEHVAALVRQTHGDRIIDVIPGGPAATAGLQAGDILVPIVIDSELVL